MFIQCWTVPYLNWSVLVRFKIYKNTLNLSNLNTKIRVAKLKMAKLSYLSLSLSAFNNYNYDSPHYILSYKGKLRIVTVWNSMGLKLPDLAIVKIKIKTSHRKTSTLTIHFSPIVPAFTIQTPKAQLSMWYMLKWWYN